VPSPAARYFWFNWEATDAYERGDFLGCAQALGRIAELRPKAPKVRFVRAGCLARTGRTEEAFVSLEQAVVLGFHGDSRIADDADFKSLHADPRWAAFLKRAYANEIAWRKTLNLELFALYESDQKDRTDGHSLSVDMMVARDRARLQRVKAIIAGGGARVARDFFHAAMILQHGRKLDDIRQAHDLALKAAEMDPEHGTARWLAAAAKDRELQALRKPQRYGTQFRMSMGKLRFYRIDPTVTDDERAEWQVLPPYRMEERLLKHSERSGARLPHH
jgi:hypothetical protein